MIKLTKSFENPVLLPDSESSWEARAAFNPCVIKEKEIYHMLYRAQAESSNHHGNYFEMSTIGHTTSKDGVHFGKRNKLIKPEYDWEKFGCEDPRVTKIGDDYYIFYTALSKYPFGADGIKVALAITKDFKKIEAKHPVTPFNAKGMALFPEKINGKYVAILTVDTDKPPAKIALAYFDKLEDIWSNDYWNNWYKNIEEHKINLLRQDDHQVEVGAPPIKTEKGWLLLHSYIRDYYAVDRKFSIEAVLLDLKNPKELIGRTEEPLLIPTEEYEMYGSVPYTVFPSGAIIDNSKLLVYYGGCDTTGCLATIDLNKLLDDITKPELSEVNLQVNLKRFEGNPIITPHKDHDWESKYTYNPAAILLDDKVHILYRAQGEDGTSVFGYASSSDGLNIDLRLDYPVYTPREEFEINKKSGFSGCEDPRLTLFEDNIYMFYTAYDAVNHTKIAMTSILKDDFVNHKWNWGKPVLVSPLDINDKNACLLPEKINNKFIIFHRTNHSIWIDETDSLDFSDGKWIQGNILIRPNEDSWYSEKVGIAAPPIKTDHGWLLIFHALSQSDKKYRLGAMLLDYNNPYKIIKMLDYPILEPTMDYENSGFREGTVFSCGAVVLKDNLYVYYGAADKNVAVAYVKMDELLEALS